MMPQRWLAILQGELHERAINVLHEIVEALPGPTSSEHLGGSLAGGSAGLAVLCAYLARADYDDYENAAQFLELAHDAVATQAMMPSLYSGFTGIAWATAHHQQELVDSSHDPNEEIDEVLRNYLDQSPWSDQYDLILGLVGFGVYFLERLPRKSARECLELILDRIDETAEVTKDGVTWFTRPELLPEWQRKICPKGYYNLGLAHGVPGVIALLGQLCRAGIGGTKGQALLEGAISWVLRQQLTNKESKFPAWFVPGAESDDCRLAWCYGDAGVASAILSAARSVRNKAWEVEALRIALRATERSFESAGVRDAAICHGASGLAHIFNRLYQASGEVRFKEAALHWLETTLQLRRPGTGIAGFSAFSPNENGEERWVSDPGLLTGATGIALVLLAACTDVEPTWDRVLLLPQSNA